MSDPQTVITRFAPSPTGHLHIGGARTALFAWAYAKGRGGRFILRVEDTDRQRSSAESETQILDSLAWLGLGWDDGPEHRLPSGERVGGDERGVGPFHQALRLGIYTHHLDTLIDAELAYHAFETPEELDAKRQHARAEKKAYRYDRAALEIPKAERIRRAESGEACVVRFRMPDEAITVHDQVLGEVTVKPEDMDDFVIRKADGFPTYHFACVVDDELMGVTHVIRGQEHLINTPKHVALQRALGFRTPVYAHLPLIMNPEGSKMSKRDKDRAAREAAKRAGIHTTPVPDLDDSEFKAWLGDSKKQLPTFSLEALAAKLGLELPEIEVDDFQRAGFLPEVVCNYIALLGWSPGGDLEKFDAAFLKETFDLPRIVKTAARFDRKKLLAFNTDALTAMGPAEFKRRWRSWCESEAPDLVRKLSDEQFALMAEANQPRSKTFRDALGFSSFLLVETGEIVYDEKAVKKFVHKNEGQGLRALGELRETLAAVEPWSPAEIESRVEAFAQERELGMGAVAQPLRIACTGTSVSPPIGATLAALGRETALARIDRALEQLAEPAGA